MASIWRRLLSCPLKLATPSSSIDSKVPRSVTDPFSAQRRGAETAGKPQLKFCQFKFSERIIVLLGWRVDRFTILHQWCNFILFLPFFPFKCGEILFLASFLAVFVDTVLSENHIDGDRLHSLAPVAVTDHKTLFRIVVDAGSFHLGNGVPESLIDDLLVS